MRKARDYRVVATLAVVLAVAAGGWLLDRAPGRSAEIQATGDTPAPAQRAAGTQGVAEIDTVDARFEQGVVMLHLKRHEYALAAFDRVVELEPGLVEAHVNRGFALVGLEHFDAACAAFDHALILRPVQANAYYGLGLCLEGLGDLAGALGAMRTFLHLSPGAGPDDEHQRRAAAAVWEWEAALAEGEATQADGEEGS